MNKQEIIKELKELSYTKQEMEQVIALIKASEIIRQEQEEDIEEIGICGEIL